MRRLTAAVFAGTLCFYGALNNREVCFGDYPELMGAAYRLGVAHPSGYPLWTLLGKLASFLPLGPLPYRMGLVAGVCGALCAACLCRLALEARCSPAAAVVSAVAFALSPVAWQYGTLFKGYLLNGLFVAVACLLCARVWDRDERSRGQRDRSLLWLSVVVGLGLSHHLTYVAVVPALAWAAWRGRRAYVPSARTVGCAVLALAVGCTPWLYFVVRPAVDHRPAVRFAPLRLLAERSSAAGGPRRPGLLAPVQPLVGTRAIWLAGAAQAASGAARHPLGRVGGQRTRRVRGARRLPRLLRARLHSLCGADRRRARRAARTAVGARGARGDGAGRVAAGTLPRPTAVAGAAGDELRRPHRARTAAERRDHRTHDLGQRRSDVLPHSLREVGGTAADRNPVRP
ncbi:MAG: DUF2723 domain-containing protein [Armatimonadetes bacterium]|nr:DUF2723 domain-containing protein [Armatimonadota bacterium]